MPQPNPPAPPPLVSVIIPVRNAKDFIQEALRSVFDQHYDNLEVVVIDDGSDDFDYQSLMNQDERIKVIRLEGRGVSHARNMGMSVAEGKYFAFLDADDVWYPGKLTAQIRYFERHAHVGVVFGEFVRWPVKADGSFESASSFFADCSALEAANPDRSGWLYTRLLLGLLVGMNTAVIRRELFNQIGGFDESIRIGEDYDFWLRASRSAEMHCLAGPVALYRIHTASAMHKLDAENHLALLLEKAHSRWGLSNPDGTSISKREFDARLATTQFSHGYSHFWRGDAGVARTAFYKAFEGGAIRHKSLVYCILAGAKSIPPTFKKLARRNGVPLKTRHTPISPEGSAHPRTIDIRLAKSNVIETDLRSRNLNTPIWAKFISAVLSGGLTGKPERTLTIFTFHKIPDICDDRFGNELTLTDFSQMMKILLENFNILPLEEGIKRLQQSDLPRFAASISFDDGYRNWLTGAVPLLERLSIPATFFISTCQLEGHGLWFERLYRVLREADPTRSQLLEPMLAHGIRLSQHLASDADAILKSIKYLPITQRDAVITACEDALGLTAAPVLFNEDDLKTLHSKGFSIGAHTVNHPILACCSDVEAREEILRSKEMLADILRVPVELFSYPNGVPGRDIKPIHVRMVQDAGFRGAVTTALGAATHDTSIFQLPRFDPWTKTQRRLLIQYLMTLRRSFPLIEEENSV